MYIEPLPSSTVLLLLRLVMTHHSPDNPVPLAILEGWAYVGYVDAMENRGWALEPEYAEDDGVFREYEEGFLEGVARMGSFC